MWIYLFDILVVDLLFSNAFGGVFSLLWPFRCDIGGEMCVLFGVFLGFSNDFGRGRYR
jgi:hypothetical protein